MGTHPLLHKITSPTGGNARVQRIANAPALTERERRRILYEWNNTPAEFPDVCVHELFEQQVDRSPDAVAVVFKQRRLTYSELNQRANQVAHYLQKRGVGPEILVGVCFDRSPEMVVALLAVWKAGGAYVPLDPSYPKDRLAFMASDAGVKILLTDEKCGNLFPRAHDKVVSLNSDWPAIALESTGNLAAASPANLAYVMYTSGSTGHPKGAMIPHSALVNYLCWDIKAYAAQQGDSVPVHSSIAFDFTIASLYPPLLTGGQIELLPEDADAQSLLRAVRRMKNCSRVNITPAHLDLLNRQLSPQEFAGITKTLVIAGENLPAESLTQWRDFAPATRLINEYGPTETVVGSSSYEVRPGDSRSGSVPIGRPIANTQFYVLDPKLQPVRPGVTGELYIGGAGVARGYLNRPELTGEKFLIDPFSDRKGARLYKTGDLARYREDGTLECLGRIDNQVKIRGNRIELGEIEAALAGHPAVRACVVLARELTPGNKQLVGYVIKREKELLEIDALRNFLKQTLPKYMVPGTFVFLDSFPLTPNGKIDRKNLPAPSHKNILVAREFIPPRTETEKKLAAIWMDLLKVERIGTHDDFFDSGGDSLLAIRVMLQIQEQFGAALSMQSFFPTATIAGLARALTDCETSRDTLAYAVPIQSAGEKPIFFCMGAGALLRPLSMHLGSDQPVFSIGLEPGTMEQSNAPNRMEELAGHLVSALYEKQPQGPYYLGGFCQDAAFAFEVARQLIVQNQTLGLLALFEPDYPSQNAGDRIATASRRMIFRVGFRSHQLRRLGAGGFMPFARSRWENLKWLWTDTVARIAARFELLKPPSRSSDLKQILFPTPSLYKPQPLECPTVIFRCEDWPIQSAGDIYFGWRKLLIGRIDTYEVPGDHLGMFHTPNVHVLAEYLKTCLERA
jgi:amino acid adenylation domain-containing protein